MSRMRMQLTKVARLTAVLLLLSLPYIFGKQSTSFCSPQQAASQQKQHLVNRSKQAPLTQSSKRRTNVKHGWSIRRAFIKPVRCTKCKHTHGDVIVILRNGKQLRLTRSGMCHSLQIAPDKRTIGWLEGDHYYNVPPGLYILEALQEASEGGRDKPSPVELYKQKHLADRVESDYLVIWRADKTLAKIGVKHKCIWQFRDGGKRVATTGAISPLRPLANIYALYDVQTGKRLAEWSDGPRRWNGDNTPPPAWARDLFRRVWGEKLEEK